MTDESQTYRVLTLRMQVYRGPGKEELVVERPFSEDKKTGEIVFSDSDAEPTLIAFDKHCQVDVEHLLRIGAIAEVTPAKPGKSEAKGTARE